MALRINQLELDNLMRLLDVFWSGEASQILSIMMDVLEKPFDHGALEL